MGVALTKGGSSVACVLYGPLGTLTAASGGVHRRVQIGMQILQWASGASVCVPEVKQALRSSLDGRRCTGSFISC